MTADRPEPEPADEDVYAGERDDPLHQASPHPHRSGREFSKDAQTRSREVRRVFAVVIVILVTAAVVFERLSWWWMLVPVGIVVLSLLTHRVEEQLQNRRAHFSRPGDHRLVLQVTGPNPVAVIRELRQILGADLVTARRLVEKPPVVLLEGVDGVAAAEAVYLLTKAGAKATTYAVEEDA